MRDDMNGHTGLYSEDSGGHVWDAITGIITL